MSLTAIAAPALNRSQLRDLLTALAVVSEHGYELTRFGDSGLAVGVPSALRDALAGIATAGQTAAARINAIVGGLTDMADLGGQLAAIPADELTALSTLMAIANDAYRATLPGDAPAADRYRWRDACDGADVLTLIRASQVEADEE
ncbi:hypothetical protein FAM22020_001961 [Propionibacterium freudenreichii]|uniref:hypothetical protein n=1 Tax=Propionibacterium freudenreichii TaxID=1744 RepID=UPI00254C3FFF|nr:hypothetical protein [Propionibacterium freudenreichii]MDK9354270.1 hypothetical protein [Propionibacterium freudenreichii]MDK9621892.1 hypothetical protein [Propionibacterium freudenreichii]